MSQIVISLTILLIPGIIATLTFDAVTQHKQWNNFIFSVYIILFGWLSYQPLWLWNKIAKACNSNIQWGSVYAFTNLENSYLNENIYYDILIASIFAVIFAYLISYCVNHKWLTKIANKFNVSDRYGDESLFYYYLNEWNKPKDKTAIKWLSVRDLQKNILYTGGLGSYSEQNGFQELILTNVDVYNSDNTAYHIDNIYLCNKIGGFSIEPLTIGNDEEKNGKQ